MIPVRGREASRRADQDVIQRLGLPGIALMETASKGVAEAIRHHLGAEAARGVVVVCGPGNNGGDGFGAARWLHAWGLPVRLLPTTSASRGDAGVMRAVCASLGLPVVDVLGDAGVIVDALYGTGLARPLEGRDAELVRAMDAHGAPIVAVDVPSGLDADRGTVLGVAPTAALTVTFGGGKPGLYAGDGPRLAGRVEVVELGLDPADRDGELPDDAELAPRWPRRAADAHKNRSGHLLIVAGSAEMAGAAVLCARGALAGGVGLVTLVAPRGAHPRLGALPPEVMLRFGGDGDAFDGTLPDVGAYDAIAAGPGLRGAHGLSDDGLAALTQLWRSFPGPMVCDADALAIPPDDPAGPRVITPHPGEAARRLGVPVAQVQGDRFAAAVRLATPGVVALLKGPHTLVAEAGRPTSINPTGHPALATGGSGDVLTGLVGALLARGCTAFDAARLAAFVHGRAGERLGARRAEGWRASDVADELPAAIDALIATDRPGLPRRAPRAP